MIQKTIYNIVILGVQEDGEATKKIPKKKPPRIEDTRSKKEHVNVVFIGHVGECTNKLKTILFSLMFVIIC
jgi:hypothetical protein